jgi:hypothetical protein
MKGMFEARGDVGVKPWLDEKLGRLIVTSYRFNEVLISALFASVRLLSWCGILTALKIQIKTIC